MYTSSIRNHPCFYIQMHTYYLDQIANPLDERVLWGFLALFFHVSLNRVFVWQEAEGKLFCDVTCKLFSILSFFVCATKHRKKRSWKNFTKSWLISQAQNAEIKMSTGTTIVSCNISKILSKVRYTRVDIGVCGKVLSTDLFCAPSLMSPAVPL